MYLRFLWHIHQGVEVTYVATDEKRREIPWVRLVDENGNEEIFTTEGTDPANPPAGERRTMDCIDCHSRPSHSFQLPTEVVDQAMADGLIPTDVPYMKRAALDVLDQDCTREVARKGIGEALPRWFDENEPLPEDLCARLGPAGEKIANIWLRNVFPENNIVWHWPGYFNDSLSVIEDLIDPDPRRRYKMLIYHHDADDQISQIQRDHVGDRRPGVGQGVVVDNARGREPLQARHLDIRTGQEVDDRGARVLELVDQVVDDVGTEIGPCTPPLDSAGAA